MWGHKGEKQKRINKVPDGKKHCIVAILPDVPASPFELLSLAERVVMLLSRAGQVYIAFWRERARESEQLTRKIWN